MAIDKTNRTDWAQRIGRRIKLRDLHILMAVVQFGSMAKAAGHLNVSQPVISKAIGDLEQTLGVRLLDRDRHGAEPTAYGHSLLRRGAAVFDELRQGVEDIASLRDATTGELRIAAADPIAAGIVPTAIKRLSLRYPEIVYHVTGGASLLSQQCDALRAREIDMIIGRLPASMNEPDLAIQVLCEEPSLVAAGAKNPWVKRRRVKLSELVDEPWVLPGKDSFVGSLVAGLFHSRGLPVPHKAVYCTSIQMNNILLATDRYLAFYPASVLRLSGKQSGIRSVSLDVPVPSTPLGLITLKGRTLPAVARLFIDGLCEAAKS